MATKIFVNLPVQDLKKSMHFFEKLGYTFNKQFTDEKAACLVISEDIYAMLLRQEFFQTFLRNTTIADAKSTTEALIALSADSRSQVDELVDKALAAGATKVREPDDHGFMYARSFHDLDGHIWEIIWMDPSTIQPQNGANASQS